MYLHFTKTSQIAKYFSRAERRPTDLTSLIVAINSGLDGVLLDLVDNLSEGKTPYLLYTNENEAVMYKWAVPLNI